MAKSGRGILECTGPWSLFKLAISMGGGLRWPRHTEAKGEKGSLRRLWFGCST